MKIVLIRHGKTEGNIKKRYIGKTDEPLFEKECLSLDYPKCETVVSSPLKRCIQTAEYIYPESEIKICADLCECDFGDFENKSYEDLKNNPDYIHWLSSGGKLPPPNGEGIGDFKSRCVRGFEKMVNGKNKSIAFVVHGGTVMAIMQSLFGGGFYDYQIKNGGMFVFEYDVKKKTATGAYEREESE